MYTNRTNTLTENQKDAAACAVWLEVAIRCLDAEEVADGYIYRDDATGDLYRTSAKALVKLGKMLERGDDEATAYSEWCSWPGTGELVEEEAGA